MNTSKQPVLGLIKLDRKETISTKLSDDLCELDEVIPFLVDDPALWQVPLVKAIATGVGGKEVSTAQAAGGIVDAARRLDGHAQLIIGHCGFMWASREHLYGRTSTPALTSALEFVDLALRITKLPVGIITWDAEALVPLMRETFGFDRLRFLSVGDLPNWSKWPQDPYGSEVPRHWTKEQMAAEFHSRLATAFAEGGDFNDVSVIVLECTLVPDFRQTIRSITSVPIFDILHFAKIALE
ncbi:hypothetical protein VSR69_40635 [Paraburkholderia phytofirmans]